MFLIDIKLICHMSWAVVLSEKKKKKNNSNNNNEPANKQANSVVDGMRIAWRLEPC